MNNMGGTIREKSKAKGAADIVAERKAEEILASEKLERAQPFVFLLVLLLIALFASGILDFKALTSNDTANLINKEKLLETSTDLRGLLLGTSEQQQAHPQ